MAEHHEKGQPRYKQVILAAAIAIVLVSFVLYGISVVYEGPKYETYCNDTKFFGKNYNDRASCEEVGGRWADNFGPKCAPGESCPPQPPGYCDAYYTCNKQFNDVNQVYERNVFFIGAVVGLIVLILGFLLRLASVSAGISIGGVIIILFSIVRYWNELNKYVRLLLLGVMLAILILIGYKKFRR